MSMGMASTRGGTRTFSLLSLFLLLGALQVLGGCNIRFVIAPKASNFTLGGHNRLVLPGSGFNLGAPITHVPGQKTAFVGALFTTFPSSTSCPTSLSSLAPGLRSSTWYSNGTDYPYQSTTGPFQGIAVQPALIYGLTAGSTYQPQNLLWNITSSTVAINTTNNTTSGSIRMQGPASLLQGFLWSESPYTGSRYDSIAPGSGNFSATGVISIKRKVVTIRLSSFNLSVTGVSSVTLGSVNYTAITALTFNGAMTLQADLGCKVYCGDYGRCKTSRGVSSCQCQCGWAADNTTGACTVATGFCSGFS